MYNSGIENKISNFPKNHFRGEREDTFMRYVIVGGVAGGRGAAARLRRLDEEAEIIMLEKGEFISFANCGLPYYLSGVIADK